MIDLRPYQQKTIESLRNSMKKGNKRLILCLPTGGGKTVVFSYMISKSLEKGNKCLILTHRTELLTQAGGTLSNFGLTPEIVNPKNKKLDLNKSLYVAMTKTVLSRIDTLKDWLKTFDFIIIDESHLQDFNSLFEFLPDCFVIGATATPERKGNQLALNSFYQELINEVSIYDLVNDGYLAQPRSYGVQINLKGIKTKAGDFDNNQVGEMFDKMQLYEGVYSNLQRYAKNKKTIIFSSNIKSSLTLINNLNRNGLNAKHIDANSKDREELINWFKETPDAILSNVGILTAGFDEPKIECVVLYRATKSLPLFLQMVGRGSRVTENKKEFIILDFGNNIQRHGFWEDLREWSLDKKSKKEGLAPVKNCKCDAIIHASFMVCPYCGYHFPKKIIDPQMVILEEIKKKDLNLYNHYLNFIKLEKKAKEKGFKQHWVLYQLRTIEELKAYQKFKNYHYLWLEKIKSKHHAFNTSTTKSQ
jgi:superfamily II DNA or RNA helicase